MTHLTHKSKWLHLYVPVRKIYVGEMVQKRSTINNNVTLPHSRHFKGKGHKAEQLRFTVFEMVLPLKRGGDRKLKLKQREVWWINKLNSLHPHDLNKDSKLYRFMYNT
ncbi:hypothetical protein XELAEV_18017147mg [Xenopus laevis]|uniref:Uncharacterized protein n=1 Tax=Xenopus laevis TaxID=8355 RepID=A0A974HSK9_XENLA|nr:hypothetical protein XELAEV_18017147mg [Xenopus laevis]